MTIFAVFAMIVVGQPDARPFIDSYEAWQKSIDGFCIQSDETFSRSTGAVDQYSYASKFITKVANGRRYEIEYRGAIESAGKLLEGPLEAEMLSDKGMSISHVSGSYSATLKPPQLLYSSMLNGVAGQFSYSRHLSEQLKQSKATIRATNQPGLLRKESRVYAVESHDEFQLFFDEAIPFPIRVEIRIRAKNITTSGKRLEEYTVSEKKIPYVRVTHQLQVLSVSKEPILFPKEVSHRCKYEFRGLGELVERSQAKMTIIGKCREDELAFKTPISNGTPVEVINHPGIKYEWRDGTVVPAEVKLPYKKVTFTAPKMRFAWEPWAVGVGVIALLVYFYWRWRRDHS